MGQTVLEQEDVLKWVVRLKALHERIADRFGRRKPRQRAQARLAADHGRGVDKSIGRTYAYGKLGYMPRQFSNRNFPRLVLALDPAYESTGLFIAYDFPVLLQSRLLEILPILLQSLFHFGQGFFADFWHGATSCDIANWGKTISALWSRTPDRSSFIISTRRPSEQIARITLGLTAGVRVSKVLQRFQFPNGVSLLDVRSGRSNRYPAIGRRPDIAAPPPNLNVNRPQGNQETTQWESI